MTNDPQPKTASAKRTEPTRTNAPSISTTNAVHVLSSRLGKDWQEGAKVGTGAATDTTDKTEKEVRQALSDILLSQNLVVLSGLGTSLCVSGAPKMSDLWAAVKKAVGASAFDSMCQRVGYTWTGERGNFEHLLSRCLLHERLVTDSNTEISDFRKSAEKTVVHTCRFMKPQQELQTHEEFLRRVARRPTNKPRTQIFTTNYDLCFEHAASRVGFAVIDGFSHTLPQRFDGDFFNFDYVRKPAGTETPEFADKVFRLFKLHGSVDWERQPTGEIVRKEAPPEPVIIYPAESKFELSYQQPFIEVMARFQDAVREPNTGLFVVGFGFNDMHIVQPILSAIRGNAALKVLILTKNLKDDCASDKNPALAGISALVKEGDPRITLLDGRFEDVVPKIPDLMTVTAEERQAEILRRVLNTAKS